MKKIMALIITFSACFFAQVFMETPIKIDNAPLKEALEIVFLNAGVEYLIETDVSAAGSVSFATSGRVKLDVVLKILLEPRGLIFVQEGKIYKIRGSKNLIDPLKFVADQNPVRKVKQCTLIFIYESDCLQCKEMLKIIENIRARYPEELEIVLGDVTRDKALNSKYNITQYVESESKYGLNIRYRYPTVIIKAGPESEYVNNVNKGSKNQIYEKEMYRHDGQFFENTILSELEHAGVRAAPSDPFKNIRIIGSPYYKGLSKVLFLGVPSGSVTLDISMNGVPIRTIQNFKGDLIWDLKLKNGELAEPGRYQLLLSNAKGNKKSFEIEILEKK